MSRAYRDITEYAKGQAAAIFPVFIFWLYIAAQIPYAQDDWTWGTARGVQHLLSADINSRYFGNIIEMVVTRSEIAKTIIMAVVFTMIPFMFARLATYHDREAVREMEASMDAGTVSKADAASSAGMYKAVYREAGEHARMLRFNICFLFGTLLMVTINSAIWRQTHGWIAGFSNFVVSALFIELFFFIFIWGGSKPLEYKNGLSKWGINCAGAFLFCIAIQLLLENVTVFLVFFGIVTLIYQKKVNRHISVRYVSMMAGLTAGAFIMFSSRVFGTLFSTGQAVGGIRKFTFDIDAGLCSIIKQLFKRYFSVVFPNALTIDVFACLTVLMLISAVLIIQIKKRTEYKPDSSSGAEAHLRGSDSCIADITFSGKTRSMKSRIILTAVPHAIVASAVGLTSERVSEVFGWTVPTGLNIAVSVMFFILTACDFYIVFCFEKKLRRENAGTKLLFIWLFIPVLMAPLAAIYTKGYRTYYTPVIFIFLISVMLLNHILRSRAEIKIYRIFMLVIAVVLIFRGIYIGKVYCDIGRVKKERDALTADCIKTGKYELTLHEYPHKDYRWISSPRKSNRVVFYKEFYGIPEEVTLVFEEK